MLVKLCVFLVLVFFSSGYKILGLFPHPGKSHVEVFRPLMHGLARKGHEVTVISFFPTKEKIPNYRDVDLMNGPDLMTEMFSIEENEPHWYDKYVVLPELNHFAKMSCEATWSAPDMQQFLKENHEFDVIITEFFNSECMLGFVDKFKAPLVGISSCVLFHWVNERFGNPSNPSYIPNSLLPFSDKMTFAERLENFFDGLVQNLFFDTVMTRDQDAYIKEFFGQDAPHVVDIRNNASLVLVNSHYSLNLPRPLVPGVVEIGGIHVQSQAKLLPNDLEKWINESAHGVIYFSLGSMIKGHTFPEEQRQAFLRAFARLPQRVLWKWETDTMPGKPDNVMIQKWMPQLDILSHPNVKAFISHGGLLGMTEAVHCGVPAVVMPQYGDQFTNAKALEANGGGVILNLREATEEKVYNALKTILDPNFRKGAQELSARFRDRPLPPLETAIYWVEYVARHRGAHHMRTAAVDMPFYKYFLLDVIAFLLLVFGTIAACMFYITRLIVRKIFGGKSQAAKVKTN